MASWSSAQRLVVGLAATRRARHEGASGLRAALAEADYDELLRALVRQRVVALIGARVVDLAEGDVPGAFRQAVAQALDTGRRVAAAQTLLTTHATTELERQGVRTAVLKGPLLAQALHGDPGLRPSDDIDLLVPPKDLERAVALLGRLGWGPPVERLGGGHRPRLHFQLPHERDLPRVEVHWRLHFYEERFSRDALERAVGGDDGPRTLTTDDTLVHLLLTYARDGFGGVRPVADLAAWWDVYGADRDGILAGVVARHPEIARSLSTSAAVAELLAGLPARAIVGPEAPRPSRLAVALRDPELASDAVQLVANAHVIDGLLTPPGQRLAYLRRRGFPPADELARRSERYREAGAVSRALIRLWHPVRLVRHAALRLIWGLRQPPGV